MKSDFKKKLNILKMNNRGSAMLTSLVAGVVMAAFATALILVCYTLYAQTNNRTLQLQCEYLAKEMCREITNELLNDKSDMYQKLNEQIYRVKPDGSYGGIWAPKGNNKSEYFDLLEYDLDTKGADSGLSGYTLKVEFSYVLNDGGTELDYVLPDDIYDETTEPVDEKWYEMDKNGGSGTGNATVYTKVTCKRGDNVYSAEKAVQVDFD